MKNQNFLKKLYEEKKLKIITPNDDLKDAYIIKSESFYDSSILLFKHKKLEETVSLLYYSMYYSVLALLFKIGIKCENHSAAIILLKELFDIDNKEILHLKKERINKQYFVDSNITEKEVKKLIEITEDFNLKIYSFIETLSNEKISFFKLKFSSFFNDF